MIDHTHAPRTNDRVRVFVTTPASDCVSGFRIFSDDDLPPIEPGRFRTIFRHLAVAPISAASVRSNDDNDVTDVYPFCPNGSRDGIAALCSDDGRFLAMMPHPERCFLSWQWPWMPSQLQGEGNVGPWLKMFQNAKTFVDN